MSLEDDWIEVDDGPGHVDIENNFALDESPISFEHQSQIVDQLQRNHFDLSTQNLDEVDRITDTSCNEEIFASTIQFDQLSAENRAEIKLHCLSPADDRDEKIARYERRIKAMEHGIRSLHTQMHSNPGIRQALKSIMLGNVNIDDDNHSSLSVSSNWEELPEEISYELSDILECTKNLGISLTKKSHELPKLSFLSFQMGDIALFLPAFLDNRRIWMAFNSGCPHYYLSQESLQVFLSKGKQREQRSSIIGKLVYIEEKRAIPKNEYQLEVGAIYHFCYAEPLYRHDLPP
jgi:hypothetical protein